MKRRWTDVEIMSILFAFFRYLLSCKMIPSQACNYVISLANATQRKEHIQSEFGKQQISFQFFDAVSPQNRLSELLATYPNFDTPKLSQGEKACLLSHFLLWKLCIEQDLGYLTIFEDDVVLGNNAALLLTNYHWLAIRLPAKEEFILRLETFLMFSELIREENLAPLDNRYFDRLRSKHFGTAGYIISNAMAKKLVEYFERLSIEKVEPIDEILFNRLLSDEEHKVYQLAPAICVQEMQLNKGCSALNSDIQNDRKLVRNKSKPKKSLKYRLFRLKENFLRIFNKNIKSQDLELDIIKYR